jgi:predicted flavoprotein YhiN
MVRDADRNRGIAKAEVTAGGVDTGNIFENNGNEKARALFHQKSWM